MFGFRRKPLVSEDMADWINECFNWFDARFDPPETTILPTRAFFSARKGPSDETAKNVVNDIARLMNYMGEIDVLPIDTVDAQYRYDPSQLSDIAGTFQHTSEGALIRYEPSLLERPGQFINTMAHEVMHARLADVIDEVPGGHGVHELATDLGCIIAGFGVFQLQAADDAGWSGYMSQNSRAFAFATFLDRRDQSLQEIHPHLSSRVYRLMLRAIQDMATQ